MQDLTKEGDGCPGIPGVGLSSILKKRYLLSKQSFLRDGRDYTFVDFSRVLLFAFVVVSWLFYPQDRWVMRVVCGN